MPFCECPFESLDDTTQRCPLRNTRDTIKSMYILANKVLNTDGSVKYGKKKVIEQWEKEHKTEFLENSFAPLLKFGFDIGLGSPSARYPSSYTSGIIWKAHHRFNHLPDHF